MLKIEILRIMKASMKADTDKAQSLLASLDNEIQRIKADGSRHPNWIAEKITEARAKAIPAIGEIVKTFDDRNVQAMAQKEFWQSKKLLLSQQRFDKDPVSDATIRSARLAEIALLDVVTLKSVSDDAKFDNNLPLLWMCFLVGQGRSDHPGWDGIDISAITIPDQDEALLLIEQCSALTHLAHNCYGQANGRVDTGLDKMTLARVTQSLRAA